MAVPTTFTVSVLINGIPAFGNGDATSWSGRSQTNTNQGQQVWNVVHWYGEALFWTPLFAHHQQDGAYHSHATPHRLHDFQVRTTPRSSVCI
ncbi:MAG: YHYH protein [Bacteroidetes bacterium]|nr:YHYH protein [Bacteroidota bacterium]